jgi:hypothetical protein
MADRTGSSSSTAGGSNENRPTSSDGSATAQESVREYQEISSTSLKIDNVSGSEKRNPISDIIFGPEKDPGLQQLFLRVAKLERLAEEAAGIMEYSQYAAPQPPEVISNANPDTRTFRCVFKPVDDDRVVSYNIYRSDQAINGWIAQRISVLAQPASRNEYLTFEDAIDDSQNWYYWLSAVNASGVESPRVLARRQASDGAAPGAVVDFTVTGSGGIFTAQWKKPATNVNTLDDFVIQYATDAAFTTGLITVRLGIVYSKQGTDNEKTYYWRIAAHNLSGDLVTNTDANLNAYRSGGWGPWTNYGAPTSVSSGTNLPLVLGTAPSGTGLYIDQANGIRAYQAGVLKGQWNGQYLYVSNISGDLISSNLTVVNGYALLTMIPGTGEFQFTGPVLISTDTAVYGDLYLGGTPFNYGCPWRLHVNGTNLEVQHYNGSSYITKGTFIP